MMVNVLQALAIVVFIWMVGFMEESITTLSTFVMLASESRISFTIIKDKAGNRCGGGILQCARAGFWPRMGAYYFFLPRVEAILCFIKL